MKNSEVRVGMRVRLMGFDQHNLDDGRRGEVMSEPKRGNGTGYNCLVWWDGLSEPTFHPVVRLIEVSRVAEVA